MAQSNRTTKPETTDATAPETTAHTAGTLSDATRAKASAGEPAAQRDEVAMVSRAKDGSADQAPGYRVLVSDDAPQAEQDAAHNLAGKQLGEQAQRQDDDA